MYACALSITELPIDLRDVTHEHPDAKRESAQHAERISQCDGGVSVCPTLQQIRKHLSKIKEQCTSLYVCMYWTEVSTSSNASSKTCLDRAPNQRDPASACVYPLPKMGNIPSRTREPRTL
jgi:hypothetical protein